MVIFIIHLDLWFILEFCIANCSFFSKLVFLQMELDPYDTSFDYGIDDQNFYDNPPIKKENIKKVTFDAKICSMVSN